MAGKYENEYLNRQLRETKGKINKRFQSYITTENLDKGYIDVPIDRKNKDMDWFFKQFPIDDSYDMNYDPIEDFMTSPRRSTTGLPTAGKWEGPYSDRGHARIPIEEWKKILIKGREISLDTYEQRILEDYHPDARKLKIENKIIDLMKDKDNAPWDTTKAKYKEGE